MKNIFLIFFITPGFCHFSTSNNVESVILMNMENGKILYEKNGYKKTYPASVTKIATALYAIENYKIDLEKMMTIHECILKAGSMQDKAKYPEKYPSHTLEPDGSTINLMLQESISLRSLFYGLMLGSGNDAANAIAYYCCHDIAGFVKETNKYLKKIGCKDTHFTNPHGLHDENHYTTAYDLAIMTKKAMNVPLLAQIVKTVTYPREETNKQKSVSIKQTNRLMRQGVFYYDKALGVKTGYTSNAGYNLVACAADDNRKLIGVILGGKNSEARYNEVINLFETAFKEKKIEQRVFAKGADVFKKELDGGHQTLRAVLEEDLDVFYYPSEACEIVTDIKWFNKKLPIYPETCVGVVNVIEKSSNEIITYKELFAQNYVDYTTYAKIKHNTFLLCDVIAEHKLILTLTSALFFAALFISRRASRKKIK